LSVDVVLLTAHCQNCHENFSVQDFQFVCPQCGAKVVEIVSGEEMQLVSIRAEVANKSSNDPANTR